MSFLRRHGRSSADGTPVFALAALLTGSLLVGVATIAGLPPFEGFDEVAHYSYIQQVAETGRWPTLGTPMSVEIDRYRAVAPLPESASPIWTYRRLFDGSADVVEAARVHIHQPRDPSRTWVAGHEENYQAQQPPLYYLVLSPIYLATKSWSLIDQLFVLRLCSYLLAWIAIGFAVFSAFRSAATEPRRDVALMLAPALWPALFPMWFPEMARLGNDSLVTVIAACAWIALLRLHAGSAAARNYFLLGAICGVGLLTKATMVPLTAAFGGYLVFRSWTDARSGVPVPALLGRLALFLATVAVVAGWWYGLKLVQTGSLTGSVDAIRVAAADGLLKGLQEHWRAREFALALLMTVLTFLWGGTWSNIIPALPLFAPLGVLLVLLAIGWLAVARNWRDPIVFIPIATLAVFCAALIHHALQLIALSGAAFAGGWYLHSMMPVLAPALGLALAGATTFKRARWLTSILIVYPPVFLVYALMAQGLFNAGCGVKRPSPFADGLLINKPCGMTIATVHDRLAVLAYPDAATVLLAVGGLVLLGGAIGAVAALRRE